jgi:hypothetical protein
MLQNKIVINPTSQVKYPVREFSENLKAYFPHIKLIIGEDINLLPLHSEKNDYFKDDNNPIDFSCPSCSAALKTNGEKRKLQCSYCTKEIFIPDSVWQKIHPKTIKQPFYLWYDDKKDIFNWDSNIYECISDAEGNLYLLLENDFFAREDANRVIALNPDMTVRWKNENIKLKIDSFNSAYSMAFNAVSELVVWSKQNSQMLLLSPKDGSLIRKVGKIDENDDNPNGKIIDFKKCIAMAPLADGNYFACIKRYIKGENKGNDFVRLDKDGCIMPAWPQKKPRGFFNTFLNLFSSGDAPYVEKIGSYPENCAENDIRINIGKDNSIYIVSVYKFAKLNYEGKFIYSYNNENSSLPHKLIGDEEGVVFFLNFDKKRDTTHLLSISNDGKKTQTLIQSVQNGGQLMNEDFLAISDNGNIYCCGYAGRVRIFNKKKELIFKSNSSLEEEIRYLKKIKEDEDY